MVRCARRRELMSGFCQAWRSLCCRRCPSEHFNDHRAKSRSAARTVRNMLVVHATEVCYRATLINQTRQTTVCSAIFWICYRAILASTERSDILATSSDSLFFIGLGQTASSTSRWVCYGATLASTSTTTTYANASNASTSRSRKPGEKS